MSFLIILCKFPVSLRMQEAISSSFFRQQSNKRLFESEIEVLEAKENQLDKLIALAGKIILYYIISAVLDYSYYLW